MLIFYDVFISMLVILLVYGVRTSVLGEITCQIAGHLLVTAGLPLRPPIYRP